MENVSSIELSTSSPSLSNNLKPDESCMSDQKQ